MDRPVKPARHEFPKLETLKAAVNAPSAATSAGPALSPAQSQVLRVKRLVQDLLSRSEVFEASHRAPAGEKIELLQVLSSLEPVVDLSLKQKP